MRVARVALVAIAAMVFLMSTFAGLMFLAGALFLGIGAHIGPAPAALFTAGILFIPLISAMLYLSWQIHRQRQRRKRQRLELEALKTALQTSAESDPYGFVSSAFMSGVLLSVKPVTRERITQIMNICSGIYTTG